MPEARGPRGSRRPGEARAARRDGGAARGFRLARDEAMGGMMRQGAPPRPGLWEGVLEPGERVIWAGRPRPGLLPAAADMPAVLAGLVLLLLALATMTWPLRAGLALNHGTGLLLVLLGLPLAGLAAVVAAAPVLAERARLARLSYMLTDRRAVIVTLGPEPDLALYPIPPLGTVRLAPGRPGSVFFARDIRTLRRGGRPGRPRPFDVGFERIADAAEVFALMRRLQSLPAPGRGGA
ncbi:MAG: hypothetical protein KJZ85_08240 [Rhodobacteraceae bacterium]|jgi:hypothetical protein|nr:hypothetical protein [Paracoccaceae bacterium]